MPSDQITAFNEEDICRAIRKVWDTIAADYLSLGKCTRLGATQACCDYLTMYSGLPEDQAKAMLKQLCEMSKMEFNKISRVCNLDVHP